MVKTPPFQCRRCKFDPWSGNLNPACAQHDPSKKRKREHLAYFKYLQQLPIEHLPPTPPPIAEFLGLFYLFGACIQSLHSRPSGSGRLLTSWAPVPHGSHPTQTRQPNRQGPHCRWNFFFTLASGLSVPRAVPQ